MMIVNELEKGIASVDEKKKVAIGSYRINEGGDETSYEIPYARSEIHVHELLENICDKSRAYRLVTHPTTGKRVYVDREITDLKGDESQELTGNLQSACSDFLDDYEDALVIFAQVEHSEPVKEFCHQVLNVCTSVDVRPILLKKDQPSLSPSSTVKSDNDEL